MKSLKNHVHNLSDNTLVRIKIYRGFYHGIGYIVNEGCHFRIIDYLCECFWCRQTFE